MKILAQTMKDGSVRLLEAPAPLLGPGCVRVRTLVSAISAGTEGNKITTGRMSLLGKAKAKPDQAKQALAMMGQIGVKATLQKVRDKLEGAQPLGYSLAGVVVEAGEGVTGFEPGDVVACAGGGYANHADEVVVPVNLVVRVPDGVDPAAASMTTLAAIALQGLRQAAPTLGENVVVVGLGAIGLMACQLAKANGCRVFAADIDPVAVERARTVGRVDVAAVLGAEPVEAMVEDFCRGHGADVVLICAATASSEPVKMAGRITRQRGRVVVVGAVGMELPRENYYEKEIAFSVSCSYGPGRYDPTYEEGGLDYPYGFVRWTEGRNMTAALDLMAAGTFDPLALVTHRYKLEDSPGAYAMIADRSEPFCGVLIDYPEQSAAVAAVRLGNAAKAVPEGRIGVGFAGMGSFAQSFLLPTFRGDDRAELGAIFTRTGLTSADVGQRNGFREAVGSAEAVIAHPTTQALVIATRHDQHGPLALAALQAGRHVFVEKPLCLTMEQLRAIAAECRRLDAAGTMPVLQVGFNRRFSPSAGVIKRHFGNDPGPLSMVYRVAAGRIPRTHWTQDPVEGGGRILGEVCHFIDLMQYVCGADPVAVSAMSIATGNADVTAADNVVINLRFADGSVGTIGYLAEGAKAVPKERLEVHGAGRTAVMENFQSVQLYGGRKSVRKCPGKGHAEEVKAFLGGIREGRAPIAVASQLATTLATIRIVEALEHGDVRRVDLADLDGPAGDA